jgi:hypothetical protein
LSAVDAPMRPAKGECNRLTASCIGDVLVGYISIASHDAAIMFEQLERVDRAPTGSVAVGDGGRIAPAQADRSGRWPRSILSWCDRGRDRATGTTVSSSIAILAEARISSPAAIPVLRITNATYRLRGKVRLKLPKLRQQRFETTIIERYRRRESSIEEALIEMYLAGCRCVAGSV